MSPEFRAGERDVDVDLKCCECEGPAEGHVSCDDGPVCDACHEANT